jgi:AraC-like DNA-binding protein
MPELNPEDEVTTNRSVVQPDWLKLAHDSHYSAHAFADLLGHALRSIERAFATDCRCGPQEWLNQVRAWLIARAATQDREPPKRLVGDFGLGSISGLQNAFKKCHGITIRRYHLTHHRLETKAFKQLRRRKILNAQFPDKAGRPQHLLALEALA